MAFETFETSRHSGIPIDLFLFVYGPEPDHYFAYTSHTEDVTFDDGDGPIVYEAIPISREKIKSSGTLDKTAMPIRVPRNTGLGDIFRVYPPSAVVTLIMRQGHLSDPDEQYLVSWSGRVLGYERQGSEAVLTCEPGSTSMKRVGLRWHYQIQCPHLLYGLKCRANQAARTVTATVESVSGLTVTLTDGWAALPLAKYRQGRAQWTRDGGHVELRQVLGVSGTNTLRLDAVLRGLEVGMEISVSAGCNHQTSPIGGDGDCTNIHENGPNYGGSKWIPLDNPIGVNNRFY